MVAGYGRHLLLGATSAFLVLLGLMLIFFYRPVLAAWSNDPAVNTPVSTQPGNEKYVVAITDNAGDIFVSWDIWYASLQEKIYVQKYDDQGNALWPANGVAASPLLGGVYEYHALVPDGAGGVYVVWRTAYIDLNGDNDCSDAGEYLGVYGLFAQRLDSTGARVWPAPVRVADATLGGHSNHDLYGLAAVTDGSGGVIIAWLGDRYNWHPSVPGPGGVDPTVTTVSAQRLDSLGTRLWGHEGALVFEPWSEATGWPTGSVSGNTSPVGLAEDGAGGAFVAFSFLPDGHPGGGITAQLNVVRIDSDGARLAGSYNDPGTVAGEIYRSNPPDFRMVADGLGGAIMAWQGDSFDDFNIYAQRVDGSVANQWGAGGLAVCTAGGGQGKVVGAVPPGLDLESDGAGGAFIAWEDGRSSVTYRTLFAQYVNAAGVPQWADDGIPVPISTSSAQSAPGVVSDGAGGAMFSWVRSNSIYAQRLNSTGVRQWGADLAITTSAAADWPDTTALQGGAAVVAWQDWRNPGTSLDIYIQGFSGAGVLEAPATPTATPTPTPAPAGTPTPTPTPTPGAVPGVSGPGLGVMAAILLLLGLAFFWRLRTARARRA